MKLQWSEEELKQFNEVRNAVLTESLGYFDPNWKTCLMVDASPVGVGAVLFQENPKDKEHKKIIAFWSQGLSDVESRYSQYEKETLAVVLAIEHFRVYLLACEFDVYSDNEAVESVYMVPNHSK